MPYREDPIPPLKQQLGRELAGLVAGWRRADIAVLLGTDAARVSDLRTGKLGRFSLESLIRFVTRLRHTVALTIEPRPISHRSRGLHSLQTSKRAVHGRAAGSPKTTSWRY